MILLENNIGPEAELIRCASIYLALHNHADGTYKNSWQDHTLITAGVTDQIRSIKYESETPFIKYFKKVWLDKKRYSWHLDIHMEILVGQTRSIGQLKKTNQRYISKTT